MKRKSDYATAEASEELFFLPQKDRRAREKVVREFLFQTGEQAIYCDVLRSFER